MPVTGDRYRVAVCGPDDTFASALRHALPDREVTAVARLPVAGEADLAILRVVGVLDPLFSSAIATVPTLVIADEAELLAAVDAGCRGFLPADASLGDVAEAVDVIAGGGSVVPPLMLGTLLRHVVDRRRRSRALDEELSSLSAREVEVFRLAATGAGREEVARALFISEGTVRTHLQRVYRKLGIHSQAELIALAMGTQREEDPE